MFALIEHPDGSYSELDGTEYAEQALNSDGTPGVSVQYVQQPHEDEPKTTFVEHGELLGVYADSVVCAVCIREST